MQAVATDGTIFTYNAQINGWLMPDVTVFEEQGFIPNFFNFPDFDGGIISTLIIGALIEPTPIGEIVVGYTLFSLWYYDIYQLMTNSRDEALMDHCQIQYNYCRVQFGYKNMDCSTCIRFCQVQGFWDPRCPLTNN